MPYKNTHAQHEVVDEDSVITEELQAQYDVVPLADTVEYTGGPRPKKLVAVEVYGFEVGRGLKRRVVIPEEIFKLAALGCSDREISTWFDIGEDSLRYNFGSILAKGREDMKQRLRQAMWANALNGNPALQIFLAKNFLGMSDSPNQAQDQRPLPWQD
jgi:hypothetical protein